MLSQTSGFLASAVFSVLVLGLFASLRDYGPEATVRQFHNAAVKGDWDEVERLSTHAEGSSTAMQLARRVADLAARGATLTVRHVDRSQRSQVVAEFLYTLPGRVEILYWVVRKGPTGWVVATDAMADLRPSRGLGFNGVR